MSWVLTIAGFIALILLHEFGHFAAAKAVGMRVERFSLFFGPALVSIRRGETRYTIGPIPLGGYVKITGMNPRELEAPPEGDAGGEARAIYERAYFRQPVWKRIVVIAAGPAMNFLIAFLLLAAVYHWSGYPTQYQQPTNIVGQVVKGSPASAVLKDNDRIVGIEGHKATPTQLTKTIAAHRCAGAQVNGCQAATPVSLTIKRGKQLIHTTIYPRYDASVKRPRIGVGFDALVGTVPVPSSIIAASGQSVSEMWYATHVTVTKFAELFTSSAARKQIHTVVGISDTLSQEFSYDLANALIVLALVSLSLAVVNLFPFLPLDGGHIFWALAEKVRGRSIPVAVMERASVVGIALVLFIFFIGFSNDLHTFANGGFHAR